MRFRSSIFFVLTVGFCVAQSTDSTFMDVEGLLSKRAYQKALDLIETKLVESDRTHSPHAYAELLLNKGKALTHLYRMDEGLAIYESVEAYGRSIGDSRIETWGANSSSALLNFKGDYEQLEKRSRRVLEIASEQDIHCISDAYTNLAYCFSHLAEHDSAIWAYEKAIRIDKQYNAVRSIHFNYSGLALEYEHLGQIDSALSTLTKGYRLLRPGVDDFKLATFEVSIADLFLAQRNLRKAREYALRAVVHAKKNGVLSKLADAHQTLGLIGVEQDSLESAEIYFLSSLPYLKKKKIGYRLSKVYSALAELNLKSGDRITARVYLDSAQTWSNELENENQKVLYYQALCRLRIAEGNVPDAERIFSKYLNAQGEFNTLFTAFRSKKLMEQLRRAQGSFKEALNIGFELAQIKDSLFRTDQIASVNEMEARFNQAENDKRIAQLDSEKRIQEVLLHKKNTQLWLGLFLGLILAALGVFLLVQGRTIKRITASIEQKNAELSTALSEKELLLREIHHRVKNNLQVISSLLSLQSREIKDDAALEAVNESRNRVKSMALIHQNLYKEDDITGIDMRDYVSKLSKSLVNNYKVDKNKVELITNIQELNLDVDTTIPLGLILNELISNTLKYAFPEGRDGKVEVSLEEKEEGLCLRVVDNGIGYDFANPRTDDSSGFGMKMIKTFSKKLEAEVSVKGEQGTAVELVIKNYKKAS